MADPNQQYAYFTITGAFDPAEITLRAGVTPTDSWRLGDLHPRTRHPRKFSSWSLRSRLDQQRELEAHVRDVLTQLDANRDEFQQISREFGGCMQLVGYFPAGYPGLGLDREIITRFVAYSLEADFDFYFLGSNRGEES